MLKNDKGMKSVLFLLLLLIGELEGTGKEVPPWGGGGGWGSSSVVTLYLQGESGLWE